MGSCGAQSDSVFQLLDCIFFSFLSVRVSYLLRYTTQVKHKDSVLCTSLYGFNFLEVVYGSTVQSY